MYRVIAVVVGALALSACSSMSDFLKPTPSVDTVRFESDPPGAEARIPGGQMCATPCTMSVPVDAPLTVTFNLAGYEPRSETIQGVNSLIEPNPVKVALVRVAPVVVKPVKNRLSKKLPHGKKSKAVEPAPRSAPPAAAVPGRSPASPTVQRPPAEAPTISPAPPDADSPSPPR